MRVLMVSDVYFPRINGVSTSIQTFRRSLHEAGHETVLIAPRYPAAGPQADADPDILRVDSRYVPRDPEDRMMVPGRVRALLPALRARQFDLVHVQTPFVAHYLGVELARKLGVPVIESYHTYFEEYLHHYVPLMPRAIMRFLARRFTVSQCRALEALVVPSTAMRDALADYGVRCPMEVIPTGLDTGRFEGGDGERFRRRVGIAAGQPTLVHVGRIAHEKNVGFLIDMFDLLRRRVPQVVLIVAGEGPALKDCQHRVHALGMDANVRFVGYLSRDAELLDCYRAGDLFVFASKTETQGLVLLEALALGTPVVSTAYMGTIEILRPERGARIAPDDAAAFARLVEELLLDPARRQALARDGQAYAREWSAPRLAARLAHLYARVRRQPPL